MFIKSYGLSILFWSYICLASIVGRELACQYLCTSAFNNWRKSTKQHPSVFTNVVNLIHSYKSLTTTDQKPVDFIGQTWHATADGKYNDTINFTLAPIGKNKEGCVIKAFSISQIAGAYNDEGQNYFNIVQLINSASFNIDGVTTPVNVDASCPKA